MPNPRVLIVCTGNSARSQMAEAFMKQYIGDELEVMSAGLDPKGLHPYAVEVMTEIGIDISQQQSKDIKGFLGQHFTYLITVCSNAEARCPIFPGVIYRLYWPFDDPAAFNGTEAEKLAQFREVWNQIETHIREWSLAYKQKQVTRQAAR
jgi:arsenate reductase (thioredoxin)